MIEEFPELTIEPNGSSGIEIRAKMPEKFNLVEYTLRNDVPVAVFISPWMQFEPTKMNDYRLMLANEIARRAATYNKLLDAVEYQRKLREQALDYSSRKSIALNKAFDMWREERVKFGLPEDFSDIKEWPPELLT